MEQKKSKYMDLGSMAHMMFAEKNVVLDSSFWGLCCAYATGAEPISNLDQMIDALENMRMPNLYKMNRDYEFNLEETVFIGHVIQFAKDLRSAVENPGDPESQDFIARLRNLSQLYYIEFANLPTNPAIRKAVGTVANSNQTIMMMLNRFAKITDEKQKYDILKSFRRYDYEWGIILSRMIANSSYATPADLERAIEVTNNPDERQAIFADIEKMSQKILTEELNKESPDMSRIQDTLTILRRRAHRISAKTGERVDKEYDLQRLLKPDGAEYVQKLSAQETMQIEAMKKQIAELEEQLRQKQQELERIREERDGYAESSRTVSQENTVLRQMNQKLGAEKEEEKRKVQRLVEGAKRIKAGFGSSGVKDYQKMAEEIANDGR